LPSTATSKIPPCPLISSASTPTSSRRTSTARVARAR
jgi:hypothetical protein